MLASSQSESCVHPLELVSLVLSVDSLEVVSLVFPPDSDPVESAIPVDSASSTATQCSGNASQCGTQQPGSASPVNAGTNQCRARVSILGIIPPRGASCPIGRHCS